jgi:hypothetical protein
MKTPAPDEVTKLLLAWSDQHQIIKYLIKEIGFFESRVAIAASTLATITPTLAALFSVVVDS